MTRKSSSGTEQLSISMIKGDSSAPTASANKANFTVKFHGYSTYRKCEIPAYLRSVKTGSTRGPFDGNNAKSRTRRTEVKKLGGFKTSLRSRLVQGVAGQLQLLRSGEKPILPLQCHVVPLLLDLGGNTK